MLIILQKAKKKNVFFNIILVHKNFLMIFFISYCSKNS